MAIHEVELQAGPGLFKGLAKQNMVFHQCINELIDNSIASKKEGSRFHAEIIIEEKSGKIGIWICDKGKGMTLEVMKRALQLGGEPDPESDRLHEHGFGLKNSLATLTEGTGYWKIWSQAPGEGICSVQGPFGSKMHIEDDDEMPEHEMIPEGCSTIVYAETSKNFMCTVQGRGRTTPDINKLKKWLSEHLGVSYREYLLQDKTTGEPDGSIRITTIIDGRSERLKVLPIEVPYSKFEIEYMSIEIGGKRYTVEYKHGLIDEKKRNESLHGEKLLYYYQGNQKTQGIDVIIGKRTIATGMLDEIWSDLSRHNGYNDFVGEIRIKDVPRGMLTTVNNKTDFNLDDAGWEQIFSTLRSSHKPQKNSKETSEKELRDTWAEKIRQTTKDNVTTESTEGKWGPGVRIDVVRKDAAGYMTIYELKLGQAQPQNVYQLKMYWDGLELAGKAPDEAVLMVGDYDEKIAEMINIVNSEMKTPKGRSYNLKIERNKDRGL